MWDNLIGKQIRRSTRNLILWNALLMAGVLVFLAIASQYYYNLLLGPFPLVGADLAELREVPWKNRVIVTPDMAFDTGIEEITVRKKRGVEVGRNVSAKYHALLINGRLLIARVPAKAAVSKTYTGSLGRFSSKSESQVLNPIRTQQPPPGAPKFQIVPLELDARSSSIPGYLGLIVAALIVTLSGWNLAKAFRRIVGPEAHPLARQLDRYGDPAEVADRIDAEYLSDDVEKIGPATLTRSWLIWPKTFGVDLIHLGDAAWVYKATTQHYTNGIPTGKTHSAVLHDVHGKTFSIRMAEPATLHFVQCVLDRVPWVVAGYDDELKTLWCKDQQKFIEMVDDRRRSFAESRRRGPDSNAPADDDIPNVEPA
jgi:hypothetical protein